ISDRNHVRRSVWDNNMLRVRSITLHTELWGAASDLFSFVLFPLYNNARKVSAGRSKQSCVREASRDVGGIYRCRLYVNQCFSSRGSGIATSSIRNTEGGPNSAKRKALTICNSFRFCLDFLNFFLPRKQSMQHECQRGRKRQSSEVMGST